MRRRDPYGWEALHRSLEVAIAELKASPDFDRFDRLAFIVGFMNPIASSLARVQRALRSRALPA